MAKKKAPRSDRDEEKGKDESARWKYLAFTAIFTFPAFIYLLEASAKISNSFGSLSTLSIYLSIVLTASLVVFLWFYFRKSLQGYYKYFALLLLPILVFPSIQVYTCSPVVLPNKEFGTKFKLATTAEEILKDCGQYCLRSFSKSLYSLSLVTPRITLKVLHGEVVDMNITTNSIVGGETVKNSRIYLIFSRRSVRGKVHSISLLTKVPFRSTKIIEAFEKKKSIELTGRIVNIGSDLKEMKGNLERKKLFIRPVVFEPYCAVVNDDEDL